MNAVIQAKDTSVSEEDMNYLRHTLGATDRYNPSSWGHRNYYASEASTEGDESMQRLLAVGYVKTSGQRYGYLYYHATPVGCDALGFTKAQKQRAMDW